MSLMKFVEPAVIPQEYVALTHGDLLDGVPKRMIKRAPGTVGQGDNAKPEPHKTDSYEINSWELSRARGNEFDAAQAQLEELQDAVAGILPAVRIAELIERNPVQARNEIRSACEAVLNENPWIVSSQHEQEQLINRYLDSVFGFGPLEGLLNNELVTEIMVNGAHSVFYEQEGKLYPLSFQFKDDASVLALIDRIIAPLGRRVDESSPMVNARLPQGHRVNAIIPPLALDGPILTIRKFRATLYTLDELTTMGSLDSAVCCLLKWAVHSRQNIAVSGGTGSGKTTLLNALSVEIPETERIITIEDSAELRFQRHPHVVRLEARPRNAEGVGEVTIKDLVINALRMRPDRIVVGECRGQEALDMIQAMTTGHDGSLTTLHANSPKEVISRLTTMVRYGAELPVEVIESQIVSAINLVIQTNRAASGERYISELVEYRFDEEVRRCVVVPVYLRDGPNEHGHWLRIPQWVESKVAHGELAAAEVEQWKGSLHK